MIPASRETATLADRHDAKGGKMALRGFRREAAPPLVFAHATGMCASAYQKFLAPLGQRYDVLAPDMRGHGRSELSTTGLNIRNWSVYARDLEAMLLSQSQPETGWRLVGHSMGAVASLLVAARGRVNVSHLILVEPVIVPAWASIWAKTPAYHLMKRHIPIARRASQRRSEWESYEQVERSYGRKRFFREWSEGVLADYLEDGLKNTKDGVQLSCAPAWEASTFAAQGQNFWLQLQKIKSKSGLKLHILLAERGSTAPQMARKKLTRKGCVFTVIAGTGHLVPQEQPQKLAEIVADALC